MAAAQDLGIARDRLNVNGGACALGHPIGAPSALADALAAVMVPSSRKAGLRVGIFSGDTFNGFSSWSTISAPPLPGTATGAISAANAPDSTACRARRSVSAA
ncbi:hypothetical protein G6F35_017907 [Rhizopus arrhizus]|nr:hypothetical protein G6F35_017907 [Rhizopus arrhizus]